MRKEVSRTKNAESRDTSRKEQKSAKSTSGIGYSSYITTQPIQPIQFAKKNETGLPDKLKAGVENLSGYRMDDVKVHYNSDKPAKVNAYAYTQGTDIHVASGQEKHLPHEAWHVVQQKEGRVKPTLQLKGIQVNDDKGLEHEADVMGAKAVNSSNSSNVYITAEKRIENSTVQCRLPDVFFDYYDTKKGKRIRVDVKRPESPVGKKWLDGGGQRDHIIPYNTIKQYITMLSEYQDQFTLDDEWILQAISTSELGKGGVYTKGGMLNFEEDDIKDAKTLLKDAATLREEHKKEREIVKRRNKTGKRMTNRRADTQINKKSSRQPKRHNNEKILEIIRRAVTWMPGNIVITTFGRRVHDRGDELDSELVELMEMKNRKINYKQAFDLMRKMISNPNERTEKNMKEANDILKEIAGITEPYISKREDWDVFIDENNITCITLKKNSKKKSRSS